MWKKTGMHRTTVEGGSDDIVDRENQLDNHYMEMETNIDEGYFACLGM